MYPTPYAEVNQLIELVFLGVQEALGERLAGFYLVGSLAYGGFNDKRSDIDFVAATHGDLPAECISRLEAMHNQVASSGLSWAHKLEGIYVPLHALRFYDPSLPKYPSIGVDEPFRPGGLGSDWPIELYILREKGVRLYGPEPRSLVDPVTPEMLKQSVLETLRGWWAPMLKDPAFIKTREYQAFAVLTMCRALYALQTSQIVSKSDAADWALATLDQRWKARIERALAWPDGEQEDDLDGTLEMIGFTVHQIR